MFQALITVLAGRSLEAICLATSRTSGMCAMLRTLAVAELRCDSGADAQRCG
jgi:hypothetical protein